MFGLTLRLFLSFYSASSSSLLFSCILINRNAHRCKMWMGTFIHKCQTGHKNMRCTNCRSVSFTLTAHVIGERTIVGRCLDLLAGWSQLFTRQNVAFGTSFMVIHSFTHKNKTIILHQKRFTFFALTSSK